MGQHLTTQRHPPGHGENQPAERFHVFFAVLVGQEAADFGLQLTQLQTRVGLEFVILDGDDFAFVLVVLVLNIADDLLDQILDGQQPVDPAVLIDDKGHVTALGAHIQKHVEHWHGRCHENWDAKDRVDAFVGATRLGGEQVLNVHQTPDVIHVVAENGQPGMALGRSQLDHIINACCYVDGDDLRAWDQHVFDRAVLELQNVGQHLALVGVKIAGFVVLWLFEDGFDRVPVAALRAEATQQREHALAQPLRGCAFLAFRGRGRVGGFGGCCHDRFRLMQP